MHWLQLEVSLHIEVIAYNLTSDWMYCLAIEKSNCWDTCRATQVVVHVHILAKVWDKIRDDCNMCKEAHMFSLNNAKVLDQM